jgi:hypothetical protein
MSTNGQIVAFLDACIVQLPAVSGALSDANSQSLFLGVQQLLRDANRLRDQIAGTSTPVEVCPKSGNRKKSGFTSKSIVLGLDAKERAESIIEEPSTIAVEEGVTEVVSDEVTVKTESASTATSFIAQGVANAQLAGMEKREEVRADWEEKLGESRDKISKQTEARSVQAQELERLKALVDSGHIHSDVLHTMCETYHLPMPKTAATAVVSTTTTTVTTTEDGTSVTSTTSSDAIAPTPSVPAPASEPAAAPAAPAAVNPLEGGKTHDLQVKMTEDGRKQSTLVFSGTTSLGVELSQKDAGGVLVSNKESELLGQHLLQVNGQEVGKLHLKDVMEVFRTCSRPITLIFEEPKQGFFGKKTTNEVHWDGVSPLGIHLANHASGKGVTVEALAETCSLADASHVGQHLVSVNGVDTTHLNLTDLVKLLRTAEKPIKLGFETLDNAMIEEAVQVCTVAHL